MDKDVYLGDGLYANFDEYQIRLFTQDQMVYLEPEVVSNFLLYVDAVRLSLKSKEAV